MPLPERLPDLKVGDLVLYKHPVHDPSDLVPDLFICLSLSTGVNSESSWNGFNLTQKRHESRLNRTSKGWTKIET